MFAWVVRCIIVKIQEKYPPGVGAVCVQAMPKAGGLA